MDFFNADEAQDQDDEDKFATGYEAFRENVLFLIDASPAMLNKADIPDNIDFENDSWLEVAIKVVREVLKMRIISSDNDQLAVVFYGTRESQNNNAFDGVYTFQDLDFPDAQRIRGLEQLLGNGFESTIGSRGSQDPEHLHYALWTATQLLSGASSKSSKRVLIFTRDDNPLAEDGNFKEQILSRAQELTETKVVLELYPMIHQDQTFDMSFWSAVLQQTEDDFWEYEGSQVPYRLRNLAETVRHKAFRKRVLTKDLRWSFGTNFEIAVSLYGMMHTAVKGTYTWLNAQNNEPLRAETAYICNDTGAVLTRANLTKAVFPNPSQYKTARHPSIILTIDELRDVKTVQPRGLRLLGFKPTSMLKHHHQLRSPTFIYPDERSMPGSSQTFIAFHNRMLAKDVMAVCSFVRVKGGEPRLVALLAQEEVQDEYQTQIQPPGMHMIYLPYSDDLRHPEADTAFTGTSNPQANTAQIAAAESMLHALNLKGFDSAAIPNPSLQRHYQVLECYALNEVPPEEIEDQTQPDIEGMSKKADVILAFRDAVYGEGNNETVKPKATAASRKRKTPEEEQAIKEEAAAIDYKGMAEEGRLGKLTVSDLKKYCEAHQLPKSGKKDDIIERIKKHMGIDP